MDSRTLRLGLCDPRRLHRLRAHPARAAGAPWARSYRISAWLPRLDLARDLGLDSQVLRLGLYGTYSTQIASEPASNSQPLRLGLYCADDTCTASELTLDLRMLCLWALRRLRRLHHFETHLGPQMPRSGLHGTRSTRIALALTFPPAPRERRLASHEAGVRPPASSPPLVDYPATDLKLHSCCYALVLDLLQGPEAPRSAATARPWWGAAPALGSSPQLARRPEAMHGCSLGLSSSRWSDRWLGMRCVAPRRRPAQ